MTSRLMGLLGTWDDGRAVAANLADRIRSLVLDGRLTVGEKLPSERALAGELGRSRATVSAAYERLAAAGFVVRLHGGSTRVSLPHGTRVMPGSDAALIDFTIASTGSTPGLHAATERGLNRLAELRGTSGYLIAGMAELRERIAARFSQRGLPTAPDEIIVTSGAMHALSLIFATFGQAGRTALVEQPTFPHAFEALRRTGHRILTTPVTSTGWDVRHLTTTLLDARPHVAYLIPDFHNPTGASLRDDDRARITATARSTGTLLIADETCVELDIDRDFTPHPFAAHGGAITVGSLSKLAWGGLRIGWIRATREQVERILSVRPTIDLGTAALEQCIAIELFDDMPTLKHHIRERLLAGRTALERSVAALPGVTMPRVAGGLSAWADLGEPVSTALSLAAQDRGLRVPAGPRFSASGVHERFIRLPITLAPDDVLAGMSILAEAWAEIHAGARSTSRRDNQLTVV